MNKDLYIIIREYILIAGGCSIRTLVSCEEDVNSLEDLRTLFPEIRIVSDSDYLKLRDKLSDDTFWNRFCDKARCSSDICIFPIGEESDGKFIQSSPKVQQRFDTNRPLTVKRL